MMTDSQSQRQRVRVGLIGCGRIGRVHAERLSRDRRVALVSVCDPSETSARAVRDEYAPAAAVITDVSAALDPQQIDAVVIASPTMAHYEQSAAALARGLHVLCEKPLAQTRGQILDLIRRRERSGAVLTVAYQRRYQAAYRTARRELQTYGERYGPVRQIHIFVCERWSQTIGETWRDDPSVGGYFADAGIHQVDSCWFIAGVKPRRVFARSDRRATRVEIVTEVLARMSGEVGLCAHFVGDAHHWREDIHFHCRDADLLIRNCELFWCRENRVEPITDWLAESTPDWAFVDAILDGVPTETPPENSLLTFDWTAAVLASCRLGGWVSLPDEETDKSVVVP
jgi:predicted dehydrogenase